MQSNLMKMSICTGPRRNYNVSPVILRVDLCVGVGHNNDTIIQIQEQLKNQTKHNNNYLIIRTHKRIHTHMHTRMLYIFGLVSYLLVTSTY